MIPQFLNKANSSFLLWVDHVLCDEGSGFLNVSSKFYKTPQTFNGLSTYSSPYTQFVYDSSVAGANIMTGIFLGGSAYSTGQQGFFGVNYQKGQVYFNSGNPNVSLMSGQFAIKDFNVVLTNNSREKILFETKYSSRNQAITNPTGLLDNELTYPIIFIKNTGNENKPFAFGGQKETCIDYSLMIFSDTKSKLDSAISLLCDKIDRYIPVLEPSEMPFDIYGRLKGNYFNYENLRSGVGPAFGSSMLIKEIKQSEFSQKIHSEIDNINPDVHLGIVDVSLSIPRMT